MRFENLMVGDRFFHALSLKHAGVFQKKSKSSAYSLHPMTFEKCDLDWIHGATLGFAKGVEVYKLET
jgi:hypothetical protein